MATAHTINTIGQLITSTTQIDLLDADILLAEVLGTTREYVYAHPEKTVSAARIKKYRQWVRRRAQDEPLAYIIGHKEFYDLDFVVTSDVLIPRPDTELLIDQVLDMVKNAPRPYATPYTIVDVGTGSGNIAVTITQHCPAVTMLATDISKSALAVARTNAKRHKTPIIFFAGDTLAALPAKYLGKIDMIMCNAPYLTKTEARKKNLAHEPQVALTPPGHPTEMIKRLLQQAPDYLTPRGRIFLEIGHRQALQVKQLAKTYLPNAQVTITKDLGGFDRIVTVQ